MSRLFDQIASVAARDKDGTCPDLAALEVAASEARKSTKPTSARKSSSDDEDGTDDGAILTEWKASDAIAAWARLSPPLAGVDLRPYLFVSKDRKDYFGATSVLGHLAAVVEKLMGPKMVVQALEGDLKRLVPAEAGQVFEELRGRIIGSDKFETTPTGVEGMTVLVRAHPQLQSSLLDFLEALPADRCGTWPAAGFDAVIKDADNTARYEKLLVRWQSSKSPGLKTTAGTALRTRKGAR